MTTFKRNLKGFSIVIMFCVLSFMVFSLASVLVSYANGDVEHVLKIPMTVSFKTLLAPSDVEEFVASTGVHPTHLYFVERANGEQVMGGYKLKPDMTIAEALQEIRAARLRSIAVQRTLNESTYPTLLPSAQNHLQNNSQIEQPIPKVHALNANVPISKSLSLNNHHFVHATMILLPFTSARPMPPN